MKSIYFIININYLFAESTSILECHLTQFIILNITIYNVKIAAPFELGYIMLLLKMYI